MDFFKQGTAVELRYAVKKEFRGKGYATKILHEVGSYLFENLDHLAYIELYIDANNKYSIQAAKNAQFKPEGSRSRKQTSVTSTLFVRERSSEWTWVLAPPVSPPLIICITFTLTSAPLA